MFAWARHAWLLIGVSLVASTASASIPDANGVFHGCYTALTGTVRLVDNGSCNLLEKAVTWSQTGPTGPAGQSVTGASLGVGDSHCPAGGVALTLGASTNYVCNGTQGPQGPAGPPGPSGVIGTSTLTGIVPAGANQEQYKYSENNTFTATAGGMCILSANVFVTDANEPRVEVLLSYMDNNAVVTIFDGRAELSGKTIIQGQAQYAFAISPGHTYKLGVDVKTYEDTVAADAISKAVLTWICHYNN